MFDQAKLKLIDNVDGTRPTAEVERLRKSGVDAETVRFVVEQARLRERAKAKFGADASNMLLTQAGLEQSTRQLVADYHASRLVAAGIGSVVDLGCGIGGDALAFARAGLEVLAVEADEQTAALATYNLRAFSNAQVVCGLAQEVLAAGAPKPSKSAASNGDTAHTSANLAECRRDGQQAVWLDPARRTAGRRETSRVAASDYSPPLDWVWQIASENPTAVKLGPAHDRNELPADAETQWISVDGSVVELVVYTGSLAREGVRRAALVFMGDSHHELTASADADDAEVAPLGRYLYEPDGAVIRARLIGQLAGELGAGMLDEHIAYLTADHLVATPFAQAFIVLETFPADPKALARELRARGIGTLEIKKRGVDIDPAAFRKKLKLVGPKTATLILTRLGSGAEAKRIALLAERV